MTPETEMHLHKNEFEIDLKNVRTLGPSGTSHHLAAATSFETNKMSNAQESRRNMNTLFSKFIAHYSYLRRMSTLTSPHSICKCLCTTFNAQNSHENAILSVQQFEFYSYSHDDDKYYRSDANKDSLGRLAVEFRIRILLSHFRSVCGSNGNGMACELSNWE